MKLIRHYLEAIEGIEIYPIIALIIFFAFFTIMVIYTLRLKDKDVKSYSNMPLDSSDDEEKIL